MNRENKKSATVTSDELINRYLNEVGENLPTKSRADIEKELRSLIQDALEERTAHHNEQPQPATTELTAAVLREFGPPKEISARYRPAEVLIGADLFPIYRQVLTITLSIVIGVHIFGVIFSLAQQEGASFLELVPNIFGSVWESLLLNAAIVTVIFAVIERVNGASWKGVASDDTAQPKASWDPYQLPPIKDPDRIKHGDLIASIVVSLFLIGGLNFFYNSIGYIDLDENSTRVYSILSEDFRQHVPWLTAAWALNILLNLLVLVQGRWNRLTRWLDVGGTLFGLFVLACIITSDTITTSADITTWVKFGLAIVMVIVIIDLARKLYRLLIDKQVPALPINTQTA